MSERPSFHPLQAFVIALAFAAEAVDYLFIGMGGANLLGCPGTTQDVQIFPAGDVENCRRIVRALRKTGFEITGELEAEIVRAKDFAQIKSGPFDVYLVFAPDGIESFAAAKARSVREGLYCVANVRDIIASKQASGRQKDILELPLLRAFQEEYEKQHPAPLRAAADVAAARSRTAES